MIPDLGPIRSKLLLDQLGDAEQVFAARKKELAMIEGIGERCAAAIKKFNGFGEAEEEIRFIEHHHVQPLFIHDAGYPQRLLHCYDPPVLLYYRGNADLNTARVLSVIGTRNHTEYGRQVTEELIASLQSQQVLVVSGLAFGIDAIAHKAALQQGLSTVGVLGHGLDTIYPFANKSIAREMIAKGGLLTEFRQRTQPDKHNFPKRNRIVAGMADATVVVETARKGGSMITAELACHYNRDLFAVPGRLTDHKSNGCLHLIQQNKAMAYTGPEELLATLGWHEKKHTRQKQRALFADLDESEKMIVHLLQQQGAMSIDALYLQSGMTNSCVAGALLNLELKNVIHALPGKTYQLL